MPDDRFQIAGCSSQIEGYSLRDAGHRLRITDYRLEVKDTHAKLGVEYQMVDAEFLPALRYSKTAEFPRHHQQLASTYE